MGALRGVGARADGTRTLCRRSRSSPPCSSSADSAHMTNEAEEVADAWGGSISGACSISRGAEASGALDGGVQAGHRHRRRCRRRAGYATVASLRCVHGGRALVALTLGGCVHDGLKSEGELDEELRLSLAEVGDGKYQATLADCRHIL